MNVFVARQPILDRKNKIYGYELLFRENTNNTYTEGDADKATVEVIRNSFFNIGFDRLTQNKVAFINFTENILTSDIFSVLSPQNIVIEILEDVEPTEEIVEACKILKEKGFTLALDDFIFDEKYRSLIDLADIIKVDFHLTKGEERKKIIERVHSKNIKFLAEKVETIEEVNEAVSYGYSYFQGYYFSKPTIVSSKKIPENRVICMQLLREVNAEEVSFDKIEALIKKDASLSYQLLRMINSAEFSLRYKVKSIRQALAYLGERQTKEWINLISMKLMGSDHPEIITVNTIVRARFAEYLFLKAGLKEKSFNAFLTGMFSLIDVILERPLKDILEELCIPKEVFDALLGEGDNVYSQILRLILAYEREDWYEVIALQGQFDLSQEDIMNTYFKAIQ